MAGCSSWRNAEEDEMRRTPPSLVPWSSLGPARFTSSHKIVFALPADETYTELLPGKCIESTQDRLHKGPGWQFSYRLKIAGVKTDQMGRSEYSSALVIFYCKDQLAVLSSLSDRFNNAEYNYNLHLIPQRVDGLESVQHLTLQNWTTTSGESKGTEELKIILRFFQVDGSVKDLLKNDPASRFVESKNCLPGHPCNYMPRLVQQWEWMSGLELIKKESERLPLFQKYIRFSDEDQGEGEAPEEAVGGHGEEDPFTPTSAGLADLLNLGGSRGYMIESKEGVILRLDMDRLLQLSEVARKMKIRGGLRPETIIELGISTETMLLLQKYYRFLFFDKEGLEQIERRPYIAAEIIQQGAYWNIPDLFDWGKALLSMFHFKARGFQMLVRLYHTAFLYDIEFVKLRLQAAIVSCLEIAENETFLREGDPRLLMNDPYLKLRSELPHAVSELLWLHRKNFFTSKFCGGSDREIFMDNSSVKLWHYPEEKQQRIADIIAPDV